MTTLKSKAPIEDAVMLVTKLWANLRSKDPSTKVGACVYDPVTGGMHLGYNGFPPGFPDDEAAWNRRAVPGSGVHVNEMITKYDLVIHAEMNAIRKALQAKVDMRGCVLYCTHVPCPNCMRDVIAPCGIKVVVYETYEYASNDARAAIVRNAIAQAMGIKLIKWNGGKS